jgi:hypothetical protein
MSRFEAGDPETRGPGYHVLAGREVVPSRQRSSLRFTCQNFLHVGQELGDVDRRNLPNKRVINLIIAMRDAVARSNDLAPGYLRMCLGERSRKVTNSLAEDRQLCADCGTDQIAAANDTPSCAAINLAIARAASATSCSRSQSRRIYHLRRVEDLLPATRICALFDRLSAHHIHASAD